MDHAPCKDAVLGDVMFRAGSGAQVVGARTVVERCRDKGGLGIRVWWGGSLRAECGVHPADLKKAMQEAESEWSTHHAKESHRGRELWGLEGQRQGARGAGRVQWVAACQETKVGSAGEGRALPLCRSGSSLSCSCLAGPTNPFQSYDMSFTKRACTLPLG